tara:strand:- start:2723 stop:3124 length:402 start_codon:yes stop_codon:yes gene_type:complete
MGRIKGGTNKKNYKYLMSVSGTDYQYFSSYSEIWEKYTDLNKSSITNILFHPERMLNNKKYTIIKLTQPVAIFITTNVEDLNGNWITVLKRVDYSLKLRQLEVEQNEFVEREICSRMMQTPTAPPCPVPVHEA